MHVIGVACSERSVSVTSVGNFSLSAHSTATIGNSVSIGGGGGVGGSASHQGSILATATATNSHRDSNSQHECPSLTVSDDYPVELLQEFDAFSSYGNLFYLILKNSF